MTARGVMRATFLVPRFVDGLTCGRVVEMDWVNDNMLFDLSVRLMFVLCFFVMDFCVL